MLFLKDVFDHIEPYKFHLVNPEGQVLDTLNTVDETTASISGQLQDRWSLSFTVEKYIDINNDGNFVLSNGYSYLEKGMEIYVEDIGYFVISEVPETQFDGYSEVKNIRAESCEIELESKDLINFYINTGKTGSKEYLDEDNVVTDPISGQQLLTRYVALYDPDHPKLSLLDLILEQLPNWSIGHVDESYIDDNGDTKWYIPYTRIEEDGTTSYFFVKGQFEEESINVYAFLTQKVAQAYRCVFVFDILNRKINCYHVSQLGEDTGIYLSSRNYQDSLTVSGATNDIYTAFNVAGAESLDISYVNFGSNQIDNLSYVLREPLVSSKLIKLYEAYLSYRGTHWDTTKNVKIAITDEDGNSKQLTRREYYSYLSKLWGKYKLAADEIKNRVPNDGLTTDWDTFTEEELNKQLDIYIDAVNFILLQYGYVKRDENGQPILNSEGIYETVLTGDALKAQMYKDNCWYSYSAYIDGVIPNIKIAIENIHRTEDNKVDPIDAWETQWELYGVDELKVKIQTYQNTIDTCKESGYDKEYEVSEHLTDYYKIYLEAIKLLDEANKALEERQAEFDTQNTLMEQAAKDRTDLVNSCKLTNIDFGFVDRSGDYNELGKAILKLYNITDYLDENYLTTSLDDIVTTVDKAEDLYQAAIQELSTQCQPQYIYSNEIENLLADENFSANLNQLVLGNFLLIEVFDDNHFGGIGTMERLRLYNFEFNPCNPSEKFSISFTNILKSQSKRDDEVFLLESQTKTNKNSISSPTYTGVDESINAILTPDLLKALTGKLASNNHFGSVVGNMIEYVNSQPNSVVNITSSIVNVNGIRGTEGEFEKFFSKYINADYINARVVISDVGEFKEMSTDIANIKKALIGTSATETGFFININADNAKLDAAWIAELVSGKITVGQLQGGIIDTKKFVISSNVVYDVNGTPSLSGKGILIQDGTQTFTDNNGQVRIQIGEDASKGYSMYVYDTSGSLIFDATNGLYADGIKNPIIKDSMVAEKDGDYSGISANKLNINSVVSAINVSDSKIEGSSVIVDGVSLDAKFFEINKSTSDITVTQNDYTLQLYSDPNWSDGSVTFKAKVWLQTTEMKQINEAPIEITDMFPDLCFLWSRISGDEDADELWNAQKIRSKELHVNADEKGYSYGCELSSDSLFYLATKSGSLITTKNNIPLMIFHKTKETEVNDGR